MHLIDLKTNPEAAERVLPHFLEWLLADEEYGVVHLVLDEADEAATVQDLIWEVIHLFDRGCMDASEWQAQADKLFEYAGTTRLKMICPYLCTATIAARAMASFYVNGPAEDDTLLLQIQPAKPQC